MPHLQRNTGPPWASREEAPQEDAVTLKYEMHRRCRGGCAGGSVTGALRARSKSQTHQQRTLGQSPSSREQVEGR